jgi:hypothetical protein
MRAAGFTTVSPSADQGNPFISLGVALTTHLRQSGHGGVLIALKLTNGNASAVTMDIEIDDDAFCDGVDNASFSQIGSSQGVYMEGNSYGFAMISRNHPRVRDVATCWFDMRGNRSLNFRTQVTADSVSGVDSCVV